MADASAAVARIPTDESFVTHVDALARCLLRITTADLVPMWEESYVMLSECYVILSNVLYLAPNSLMSK